MIVSSFTIQANVITIVNYNCKTFMVQATDHQASGQVVIAYQGQTLVQNKLACLFHLTWPKYENKASTGVCRYWQHDDTEHSDIQHSDIQHNDSQHNGLT